MNYWLLHRFNKLRRQMAERGLMNAFCRELRAAASPDGSKSLFEVIEATGPVQWRAAAERAEGTATQMALTDSQ
jgi:hypothetical protein